MILQMVAVGVVSSPDEVADFPFVDRPDIRAVRDGVTLLTEIGALTTAPAPLPAGQLDTSARARQFEVSSSRQSAELAGDGGDRGGDAGTASPRVRLTDVGRALAQLPIDPRLARMVVE